ncbi:cytochrome P450 [Irpex lacteus]|nr:cytochrome P450 [Irpex lacteus]
MLQGYLDHIYSIIAFTQREPGPFSLPDTRAVSPHVAENRSTVSAMILIAVSTYLLYLAVDRYRKPRVPGPSGLPLLGNTLQVPDNAYFLQYTEWAKKYGSFYSLNLLGNRLLVVNDHKSAIDLLERRSHIYSGRPRNVMVNELLAQQKYIGFVQHGDLWRRMRRATERGFNAKTIQKYEPFQMRSAAQVTALMVSKPYQVKKNLEIFAITAMFTSVYGRFIETDSTLIRRAKTHIDHIMEHTAPTFRWYEMFPLLKHVPARLARWKREALEWHEKESQFFKGLSAGDSEGANEELGQHGFVSNLQTTEDKHNLSNERTSWLAGSMLGIGADTTAVATENFLLAMLHYPEVMRKAQSELDAVVGRDRAPTFEDVPKLPYLGAMVKETLRWRPVAPLGIAHASIEDDYYEGYFIPKDTVIVPNIWSMNRDPALYPDFENYRPERFLDETGQHEIVPAHTHNMGHVTYGFGRRSCVGMHFANQGLFIVMATMLWAVDILPCTDESGEVVIPTASEWDYDGITAHPAHFDCRFVPRDPYSLAILEARIANT